MKKIIGGKKYDTETAKQVSKTWSAGEGSLGWTEETLYRKKTGEYFLHGEGGPQTRYAEAYGQSGWTGGERIMPLTYDEASEWAEQHMDADAYIAAFGDPGEGGDSEGLAQIRGSRCMWQTPHGEGGYSEGLAQMAVRIPESTMAAIDRMVSATGRGKAELVAEALQRYLQEQG